MGLSRRPTLALAGDLREPQPATTENQRSRSQESVDVGLRVAWGENRRAIPIPMRRLGPEGGCRIVGVTAPWEQKWASGNTGCDAQPSDAAARARKTAGKASKTAGKASGRGCVSRTLLQLRVAENTTARLHSQIRQPHRRRDSPVPRFPTFKYTLLSRHASLVLGLEE